MEKLLAKAMSGNDEAFEELIKLKSESIVFTALKILRNHHDAEDVAQEVILRVYKSLRLLKDPSQFNAWLKKITINRCYSFLRKKVNQNEKTGMDEMFAEIRDEDREFLPQEYAESAELSSRLRKAIDKLPGERQLIVTMYYYDEMKYDEIAYALGRTKGYVASSMSRAKESIRKDLSRDPGFTSRTVDRNAALPVMSVVMAEQARNEVSRATLSNLVAFTRDKVVGSNTVKSGMGLKGLMKGASALLVSTLLVTAGVVYAIDSVHDNITGIFAKDPKPPGKKAGVGKDMGKGDILVQGQVLNGDYVNPTGMTLTNIDDRYESVDWKIVNKETDEIHQGAGLAIDDEVRALYEQKADGRYTVYYTAHYGYGDLNAEIDFVIDTSL